LTIAWESHKGLAWQVANKFKEKFPQVPLCDLEGVGFAALWRASNCFQESRGVKFSTYATRVIVNDLKTFVWAWYRWSDHHQSISEVQTPTIEETKDDLFEVLRVRLSPLAWGLANRMVDVGWKPTQLAEEMQLSQFDVHLLRKEITNELTQLGRTLE